MDNPLDAKSPSNAPPPNYQRPPMEANISAAPHILITYHNQLLAQTTQVNPVSADTEARASLNAGIIT